MRSGTFKRGRPFDFTVIAAVGIYAILFWGLRSWYWTITTEEPFSDIADYVAVGQRIATDFFFGLNESYYSYWTPVTPTIIAITKIIGGGNFQAVFRVLVQTITFFGTLLLAYEIWRMTGRKWLGVSLLFIVALTRPSIFWSLKLGTEAASEAFLISSAGISMHALRTQSLFAAFLAGVICLILGLNRPQFLPSTFLVGACFALAALYLERNRPNQSARDRKKLQTSSFFRRVVAWRGSIRLRSTSLFQAGCFAIGVAFIWSPWIIRNYVHYGAFVPTSTSGAEGLLWEYQGQPIRQGRYRQLALPDGTTILGFNLEKLRENLRDSPNDYTRSRVTLAWGEAWLAANWPDLPRLVLWRLKQLIWQNGASGLTKVPRDPLYGKPPLGFISPYPAVSWLDLILLDKTPWICFIALAGAALLVFRVRPTGLIIPALWLPPWFVIAAIIGYERYVESMISLTLWLALYALAEVVTSVTAHDTAKRPLKS